MNGTSLARSLVFCKSFSQKLGFFLLGAIFVPWVVDDSVGECAAELKIWDRVFCSRGGSALDLMTRVR
jgi:hypothetical protein